MEYSNKPFAAFEKRSTNIVRGEVIKYKMDKNLSKHIETDFNEILQIIEKSKINAFRAINHELIAMYWEIGK